MQTRKLGRTGLDLPGQCGAGGEGEAHRHSGVRGVGLADLLQRIRQRGGREHGNDTFGSVRCGCEKREDQARELFAKGGPLRTKKQVVLLGDLNSGGPKDKVGTGFTTPGDEGAYDALVDDFGMTNLGTRQTCCYPDVFESAIGDYRFDHTVDHVMAKPKLRQVDSYVTGDDPSVNGPGGVVASDHGGPVSKLKLK